MVVPRGGSAWSRARFAGKGQALSEVAPSVGGGAVMGQSQVAQRAGVCAAAAAHYVRVLQAAKDLGPVRLQAQLDQAVTVLGLARCIDDIVIPAMRELRRLLETGQRDAAQYLLATEAARNWLSRRESFAPSPQQIGPILLACGPRDRDTLGLECLALLLRFQRWPCRVLGARISRFTLTVAAQASDATGVVVISTEGHGLAAAIASLRAVDTLGIPVFYTGYAFEPEHRRRHVPGHHLGARFGVACAQLINTLAPGVGSIFESVDILDQVQDGAGRADRTGP